MNAGFKNVPIHCWEHTRSRLGKHRPFICLQAASEGVDVLRAALDTLQAKGVPSQITLSFAPSERAKSCSTLVLKLLPESADLTEMSLQRSEKTSIFEFSDAGLACFRAAALTWRNGGEDFCAAPSREQGGDKDLASGEAWFWTLATEP